MNELAGFTSVFIGGASGVVAVEAAKFAAATMGQRASQKLSTYRRGTYWAGLVVLVIVAGFVTVVSVGAGPVEFVNAVQIGVNAPALITAWATASQRDAIRKKLPSAGFRSSHANKGSETESQGTLRTILHDQAW